MGRIGFQYNDFSNRPDMPHAENAKVDELMISNMLSVLNNPTLVKMLDDEELKCLLQTVKNHVVIKSTRTLELQTAYLNGVNGKKFR